MLIQDSRKYFSILLILFPFISFCQPAESDYCIYKQTITKQINLSSPNNYNSVIIINPYNPSTTPDFEFIDNLNQDTIAPWLFGYLHQQSDRNEAFATRILDDPQVKMALLSFQDIFSNHPILDIERLKLNNIKLEPMSHKRYHRLFGNRGRKVNKAWKKINMRFKAQHILMFSKIDYIENLGTLYYEHHCGGLCGSGNIVMYERINGAWKFLGKINIWKA